MSIISFGYGVGVSLDAAEQLKSQHGINCEVVNLRTLRPLDTEAIVKSVKKTNHLVSVETGWPQCGIGSDSEPPRSSLRLNIVDNYSLFILLIR